MSLEHPTYWVIRSKSGMYMCGNGSRAGTLETCLVQLFDSWQDAENTWQVAAFSTDQSDRKNWGVDRHTPSDWVESEIVGVDLVIRRSFKAEER